MKTKPKPVYRLTYTAIYDAEHLARVIVGDFLQERSSHARPNWTERDKALLGLWLDRKLRDAMLERPSALLKHDVREALQ